MLQIKKAAPEHLSGAAFCYCVSAALFEADALPGNECGVRVFGHDSSSQLMCGAGYEGNLSRTDADFLYRDDNRGFSHEASTARAEKMQNAGVFW